MNKQANSDNIDESSSSQSRFSIINIFSVCLLIGVFIFSVMFLSNRFSDIRQQEELRLAAADTETRQINEIEAIKGKMRSADSKHEMACVNAAGFHYPEESTERELARMRRIETCINQLAKSDAK